MTEKVVLHSPDRNQLVTFDNPNPQRNYHIETLCPEFTSVCPVTGQPDYGTLTLSYVPDRKCVELKSLKLYLQRFRNEGIFYEAVTNRIFDDLYAVLEPRYMKLHSSFTPRGGLATCVTVEAGSPCPEMPQTQKSSSVKDSG